MLSIKEGRKDMFYLTTHSIDFIYGYIGVGHMVKGLYYTPPHKEDSTHHGLCYTSRGTLAGTRSSSVGPP